MPNFANSAETARGKGRRKQEDFRLAALTCAAISSCGRISLLYIRHGNVFKSRGAGKSPNFTKIIIQDGMP